MHKRLLPHLALLATNLFFAINFSAIKHLMNNSLVKPFGLNVVRVGVTTIMLWILFAFKKERSFIQRKDVGRFILCGLTGIALNQLLFLKGLQLTYPIHASLLMLVTPIIIIIAAAWLLKERLTSFKIAGLVSGLFGAAILISSRSSGGAAADPVLGDILVIINAASYAVYFILVKPLMTKYPPIMILRMVFTIGTAFILPFGWREFNEIPWDSYLAIDWFALFMIVIGGTFFAYLFNVYGIKHLGASVAGSYIYSQPAFAAVIAMIVLKERLSAAEIFAGLLIFSGVYFSNRRSRYKAS